MYWTLEVDAKAALFIRDPSPPKAVIDITVPDVRLKGIREGGGGLLCGGRGGRPLQRRNTVLKSGEEVLQRKEKDALH